MVSFSRFVSLLVPSTSCLCLLLPLFLFLPSSLLHPSLPFLIPFLLSSLPSSYIQFANTSDQDSEALYGKAENALKAAGHELKGLLAYLHCGSSYSQELPSEGTLYLFSSPFVSFRLRSHLISPFLSLFQTFCLHKERECKTPIITKASAYH